MPRYVQVGECEECHDPVWKQPGRRRWRCACMVGKPWVTEWQKKWVRRYDLGEPETEPQ